MRVELPVAVHHQTRRVAQDRGRIEPFRKHGGHARRADIPANVPREFLRRQAQVTQFRRHAVTGVIAHKHEAAARGGAEGKKRRHVYSGSSVTFTVTSMLRNASADPE